MNQSIGKSLEALGRRIRPYLSAPHRRSFRESLARGLAEIKPGEKIVCCDFANPAIDAVGGRYYFSLVRDLIDAGYFPVFTAHRATLSSFGTSRMKSLLLRERLGVIRSLDELTQPYFLITDRDIAAPERAQRVVKVDYEWRLCQKPNDVAFPIFVHPQITTKVALPMSYPLEKPRSARLFFGGNTEPGKYDQTVIREVYQMLTRREMLAVTIDHFLNERVFRPLDAGGWLGSDDFHSFVLCETQCCKIPQERWLEALSKADFFLACPGVGMPLCHNLIEALAAGAIPILQYAAYLPEPLRNRINCLTFNDADGLREVIQRIESMTADEILLMRQNVRAYYDEFLAPGQFTNKLFRGNPSRQTLLLNAYRIPR